MKTKLELEKRGYQVHFVPTSFVAEAFAEEFLKLIKETNVFYFRREFSKRGNSGCTSGSGVSLDELIVYGTKVNIEKSKNL